MNIDDFLNSPKEMAEDFFTLFKFKERNGVLLGMIEAADDLDETGSAAISALTMLQEKSSDRFLKLLARNFDAIFDLADKGDNYAPVMAIELLTHAMPVLNEAQRAQTLDMFFTKSVPHKNNEAISDTALDNLKRIAQESRSQKAFASATIRNFELVQNLQKNEKRELSAFALGLMSKTVHLQDEKQQQATFFNLFNDLQHEDFKKRVLAENSLEAMYKNKATRPTYLSLMLRNFDSIFSVAADHKFKDQPRLNTLKALDRITDLMNDEQKAKTLGMSKFIWHMAMEDHSPSIDYLIRADAAKLVASLIKKLSPKNDGSGALKTILLATGLGILALVGKPKTAEAKSFPHHRPNTISIHPKTTLKIHAVPVFNAAKVKNKSHQGRDQK